MEITKIFNKYNFINLENFKEVYLTKEKLSSLIKIIPIGLYILFNISLFIMFMFCFTLLYIKQLSFGYILEVKPFAFIYSIICAWINLFLLSPIVFIPNLLLLTIFNIFYNIKLFFHKHKH